MCARDGNSKSHQDRRWSRPRTSQHAEVDELIGTLEHGRGDRHAVFTQLAPHATIEEKISYPAVMTRQTEDQLREAVEAHLGIKRVLADMIARALDQDTFDAKLSVLKEQLSHHAREEDEQKLFPRLRTQLSADERAALGSECLARYEALIAHGHPMTSVPGETAEAAPLPPIALS